MNNKYKSVFRSWLICRDESRNFFIGGFLTKGWGILAVRIDETVKANRFQPPWPHLAIMRSLQNHLMPDLGSGGLGLAICEHHNITICVLNLKTREKVWVYHNLLPFSFHSRSLSPWWPLGFFIFSPSLQNFHVVLPTKKKCFLCFFLLEFRWPVAYFLFFSFSKFHIDNRDTETISSFCFRLYWL